MGYLSYESDTSYPFVSEPEISGSAFWGSHKNGVEIQGFPTSDMRCVERALAAFARRLSDGRVWGLVFLGCLACGFTVWGCEVGALGAVGITV